MVDGVILVIQAGRSTRDVLRRARQELGSVGAKIFGVVLNNLDIKREGTTAILRLTATTDTETQGRSRSQISAQAKRIVLPDGCREREC